MDFQDAIRKIEERGDFNRYAEMEPIFKERLDQLHPDDHTERGICYYYLLASYLKADLVHETEEAEEYFKKMDEAFAQQERIYRQDQKHFSHSEVVDFFRLLERYYNSLEFLYVKHDFKERKLLAYTRKMEFRQTFFLIQRNYAKFFEYKCMEVSSHYGTSLSRWALSTLVFALTMAIAFAATDLLVDTSMRTVALGSHWFDYFYLSVVTLTTVGFGDIVAVSVLGKMLVMCEAFFGFLMIGIFINMLQKRL